MRKVSLLMLLGCVGVAVVAIAVALGPLLEVGIEGVVEVPQKLKVADIKLVIDREEGSQAFDLGELFVPRGNVITRLILVSYEGTFNATVSGVLRLESSERSYAISMPCAIAIGEPCYRVMVLIPGYDAPMPVEEGTYRVKLTLSWRARGSGKFHARLYLERVFEGGVRVSVAGVKPESTDGWIIAENSTRSYSMLLSSASSALGKVRVWIWIFDPQETFGGVGVFRVIADPDRKVVGELEVRMFRDGPYWSVLLDGEVEPGRSYTFMYTFSSITLSAKVAP